MPEVLHAAGWQLELAETEEGQGGHELLHRLRRKLFEFLEIRFAEIKPYFNGYAAPGLQI